ncbi:transmembrane protein 79 [Pseudorasbora parva]|uniref:transmembrane protein 79 n=1 Tax=Pseudorasbora parva TaxID=51549 RepID=UPI00351DD52A
MMETPEDSEELNGSSECVTDLTRAEAEDPGSDSRTESPEDPEEGRDDWMEAEENDADDEEEDEEEDDRGNAVQAFTPTVMIVQPAGCEDMPMQEIWKEKIHLCVQNLLAVNHPQPFHPLWIDSIDKPKDSVCVEVVRVCVCVAAAALMFPLLTWAGYKLLPFEAPPLHSSALRLIYTLRCAFFASLPIVLGVLVQGVSRLRLGSLKPLLFWPLVNREVSVHRLFVRDSLHLFLLYFLQLAVMATYAQPEMLKLVPLLTIIFVLGRLIYWVCVALDSSVSALGFSLSFLPLLVLLGANLYFIGSVSGQEAVFNVAPPTTAPPPKPRWWG